jgi:hypothetical protein
MTAYLDEGSDRQIILTSAFQIYESWNTILKYYLAIVFFLDVTLTLEIQ